MKKVGGEVVEVTKANISAAFPTGALSAPVFYNGGVIYTVPKSKMFRALRVRGDKWTETQGRWGGSMTQQEAWQKVVDAIDKHHAIKTIKKDHNITKVKVKNMKNTKKEGKVIKTVKPKKHKK